MFAFIFEHNFLDFMGVVLSVFSMLLSNLIRFRYRSFEKARVVKYILYQM